MRPRAATKGEKEDGMTAMLFSFYPDGSEK